jgi:hypothetical protein
LVLFVIFKYIQSNKNEKARQKEMETLDTAFEKKAKELLDKKQLEEQKLLDETPIKDGNMLNLQKSNSSEGLPLDETQKEERETLEDQREDLKKYKDDKKVDDTEEDYEKEEPKKTEDGKGNHDTNNGDSLKEDAENDSFKGDKKEKKPQSFREGEEENDKKGNLNDPAEKAEANNGTKGEDTVTAEVNGEDEKKPQSFREVEEENDKQENPKDPKETAEAKDGTKVDYTVIVEDHQSEVQKEQISENQTTALETFAKDEVVKALLSFFKDNVLKTEHGSITLKNDGNFIDKDSKPINDPSLITNFLEELIAEETTEAGDTLKPKGIIAHAAHEIADKILTIKGAFLYGVQKREFKKSEFNEVLQNKLNDTFTFKENSIKRTDCDQPGDLAKSIFDSILSRKDNLQLDDHYKDLNEIHKF